MNDMHLGKIAEHQFIVDASKRNLLVSRPVHDFRGYDLIVQGNAKLYKIQIKSTRQKAAGKNSYRFSCSRGSKSKQAYTKDHVDYFAFYIFELNAWFIVPIFEIKTKNINIFPHKPDHKYTKYLEAWHLIQK
jgi:hypothetical protein